VLLHPFASVREGYDSNVGAEAGRDQRRRGLGKTQRRLRVHFMMQGCNESRVERIAAARRVGDLYGIGGRPDPRSVAVSVKGAWVVKLNDVISQNKGLQIPWFSLALSRVPRRQPLSAPCDAAHLRVRSHLWNCSF